jgi:hypothetical protein
VGVNDIVCGEKTKNVDELREVIIRAAVYQRNIRMYQIKLHCVLSLTLPVLKSIDH